MNKRLLALLLSLAICIGLAGCVSEKNDNGGTVTTVGTIVTSAAIESAETTASAETAVITETVGTTVLPETAAVTVTEAPVTTVVTVASDVPGESQSNPLLYKVTDGNGNIAWLFGSIHIGRDSFYPLPDYVMDAFESSDALAVEFNINEFEDDMSAMVGILQTLCYTDGTTIKDHIDEETYNKAVEILEENGFYNALIDYYIPSLWSSFIDECVYTKLEVDMESGIDRYFINLADDRGKEILDVESAEYQFGMLADFSPELQEYLLKSSVESYGEMDAVDEELNVMMDLWASGNEEEFTAYLNSEGDDIEDPDELRLYEEYNEAMLVVRNKNMTEYVEDALRSGKEVFICVGAAHIVGEGAVADQLRSLGYTVELVG